MLPFIWNDGGRAAAGIEDEIGDCVIRAISIATGLPYRDVYGEIEERLKAYACSTTNDRIRDRLRRQGPTPRYGVPQKIVQPYLSELGWHWVDCTMGPTVHLKTGALPTGFLMVRLYRHLTVLVDGVIHDTHDPNGCGRRKVLGYFQKEKTA